tara:strand:+ start:403 stop:648 length:246 start_codon:yes stop_codon:yes gene_type:complete
MGSQEIRHAFFSQKQKERIFTKKIQSNEKQTRPHTNIYLTTDGREVEITEVCKDPYSYNKKSFPDFVYLGQVTKWVRLKYY